MGLAVNIDPDSIIVGRVLCEDDEYIAIEFGKSDESKFTVQPHDRFYTAVFVNTQEQRIWVPWREENES